MEHFVFNYSVVQKKVPELGGYCEQKKLPIRFLYCRATQVWNLRTDSYTLDYHVINRADLLVWFTDFTQQLYSDNCDSDRYYESFIVERMTALGVPKSEYGDCVKMLFRGLREMEVVNAELPILMFVFDTLVQYEHVAEDLHYPNSIPASRSFIQGLEPVTLDSDIMARSPCCAVCLDDFEQGGATTRLPCTHHFHLRCIVQCLERSHLCPLCRYVMPMEED